MSARLRMTQVTGFCLAAGAFLALAAQAQRQTTPPQRPGSQSPTGDDQTQVARPVSVEVPAVNYFAQGETKVEFSPTPLMPGARGQGRVKVSNEGSTSIKVQFTGLKDATTFGNEFLTYILWGSVPKGRTLKISELALKGDHWDGSSYYRIAYLCHDGDRRALCRCNATEQHRRTEKRLRYQRHDPDTIGTDRIAG
jgi:hypothetical protein